MVVDGRGGSNGLVSSCIGRVSCWCGKLWCLVVTVECWVMTVVNTRFAFVVFLSTVI